MLNRRVLKAWRFLHFGNNEVGNCMCIIFIAISGFLAVSFYMNGDIAYAVPSAAVGVILLIFFIRNLINNSACLFGRRTDCNKK